MRELILNADLEDVKELFWVLKSHSDSHSAIFGPGLWLVISALFGGSVSPLRHNLADHNGAHMSSARTILCAIFHQKVIKWIARSRRFVAHRDI